MKADTVPDALRALVALLTKQPGVKEETLTELFKKYNEERQPKKRLSSKSSTSWNDIIFKGGIRSANLDSELYCLRMEDAVKYLGLVPADLKIGKRSWLDYLNEIHRLIEAPPSPKSPVTEGLAALFGMDARHYSVGNEASGEYFGYRRSSNSGRIVRFHIKINESAGRALPTFENTYLQDRAHWFVHGHCMTVRDETYLLGQARDATAPSRGLGLRFFVLNPYKFDWWSGLLSSLDKAGKPIATRIVLIPAEQHVTTEGKPVTDILDYISRLNLTAHDLTKQIAGPSSLKDSNADIPAIVQALIWNGTVRTLHCAAEEYAPTQVDLKKFARVFEFQKLALANHPRTTEDIALFVDLLEDAAVWDAVKASLTAKRA